MRSSDGFTVEDESDRPWARVWHPQGFSDPGCEAFLTFWAWQDAPVRRLRRDANELAAAWNGLRTRDLEWTTATWADWHKWVATLTGAERTPRQVARHVDTLYRYYAFWHWYDPRRAPDSSGRPIPGNGTAGCSNFGTPRSRSKQRSRRHPGGALHALTDTLRLPGRVLYATRKPHNSCQDR